ncbi:hypothetical protein LTR09_006067 [Extremus antarcticus]|uniref:Uncharacterized protein n=1 Tax=Extremus antarcticus TaxID=702011 RepID=A0AAJ0G945_9PEZI|nr:hypothetical protein LTR09_006067 [Extremus antarcticus]
MAHVAQGVYYKKVYTWVIAMSALWQTIAAWFVLILVAPLWTNGFVYMVMGRMVWNFTRQAKILGISAWYFTSIFVVLDGVAFAIQLYGAASTQSGGTISSSEALKDLHIYMAGVESSSSSS